MLLVNNSALDIWTPAQLRHAAWNRGAHFADMIFPWFLLIVGAAIPYSVAAHRARGFPRWRYGLKALTRAAVLVLLGCLINSSFARRPMFDLGILQLIGLSYLVAALLYEPSLWWRLFLAGGLLVAHWGIIRFLPIPGVGAGVFTESENAINYINRAYLHRFDLSGLISLAPTTALVLIGTAVGDELRRESDNQAKRVWRLMAAGLGLVAAGLLWNLDLPFNKPLWTASYILYTAGWGCLVLAVFYLLIDVKGWRAWSFPLIVLGMNAIVLFVAPILVKVHILREWNWRMPDGARLPLEQASMNFFFAHAGRIAGGWLYTFCCILLWWLAAFWMYRRKIFLRV
jgi:predicted acyltransferase